MKTLKTLFAIIALLMTSQSHSENVWVQDQSLSAIQILNSGNFIIRFPSTVDEICQGSGKIMHVYEGNNGVNAIGLQALFASSMAALAANMKVDVKFDDANSSCFVRELIIKK